MTIEHPHFLPAAAPHVDSSSHKLTSIPDVWRHYDVDRADRKEPAVHHINDESSPAQPVRAEQGS